MNTKLYFAAALLFLALPAGAQTIIASDNAADAAYNNGYGGGQNGGTGFGAFNVNASGPAGTFVYTAAEGEGNNGTPKPSTIDTSGKSFGLFAQSTNNVGNGSITITRNFSTVPTVGGTFALDFVTGYNDGVDSNGNRGAGSSGVSLTNAAGAFGTFDYLSNDQYQFNGTTINGQGYTPGALHLVYDITSATTYSLNVSGAINYTGTSTFAGPVTGFQIAQANSGSTDPAHNAYFNNLVETRTNPVSAAPEPSEVGLLLVAGLGVLALVVRRRFVRA